LVLPKAFEILVLGEFGLMPQMAYGNGWLINHLNVNEGEAF